MAAKLRRITWGLVLVTTVCVVIVTSVFGIQYPGVRRGLVEQMRVATLSENRNLLTCIAYWLRFMQGLERREATGIYGFRVDSRGGTLGDCLVLFHEGLFEASARCQEGLVARRGESKERLFWLAVTYMRLAETDNCLAHEMGQRSEEVGLVTEGNFSSDVLCSLPLRKEHDRPESSWLAIGALEKLLAMGGRDKALHEWLLNFAYMTVGGFPEKVPAEHRLWTPFVERFYGASAQRTRERYAWLRFHELGEELGVALKNTGRGVAVEDFDGDGDLDMMTGGAFEYLVYLQNEGENGFKDVTVESGLAGITQPFLVSAADYDNDGWIDIFLGRPFDAYLLYRNLGNGSFVDVTRASGLEGERQKDEIAASWSAAWGDIDNDGDLDLFVAQWGMALPLVDGLLARRRMDSRLFVNDGGVFSDRTAEFGLAEFLDDEFFVGASFGDFDNDGDADLFLSSPVRGASVLLENRGRRFAVRRTARRAESGFYTAFVDVDHDGWLDIFQGGFSDARTSTEMTVFGRGLETYSSGHSTILLQESPGVFKEHNEFFGGDMPMATMGASFGDVNNDGCWDFYLGTGNPESWFVLPNLFYVGESLAGQCTGRMENVSMLEGLGTIQKGHGVVFFDFDGDGDQDVYSSLGGMWPGDAWPNQLFVNDGREMGGFVRLRLRGRKTNRFGLGARISVRGRREGGGSIVRRVQMDNKTGFGSTPYIAHVGMSDAIAVENVEVFWPASACVQKYDVDLNETSTLDEMDCWHGSGSQSLRVRAIVNGS